MNGNFSTSGVADDFFTASERHQDNYVKVNRSDIKFEDEESSADFGLSGFILKKLFADLIFVEYTDINDGFTETNGLFVQSKLVSNWRKGIIRMVSPYVETHGVCKVGDMVVFPNNKGLPSGKIKYRNENGEIVTASNAVFLTENKLFGTVDPEERD